MRKELTELIAPASNRFVTDDNQQVFDITKAELKPEIPAHRATYDCRPKSMTVLKPFRILHFAILLDHLSNDSVMWPTLTARLKRRLICINRAGSGKSAAPDD
ncbi:hypothetical protein LJR034_009181 [Caballeronia sp. LjRoot34]|uniref:hypothetical protein n=1 Tax=Caballeronia sp. LjRoot34 TaxID=3342325 RepID=UPI003ECF34A3